MNAVAAGSRIGGVPEPAPPCFTPKGLQFFRQLERNNDRDWFAARKGVYEAEVKGPMLAVVAAINEELRSFAARLVTEPKRALYRIYRDTRFAKDKTPYKDHQGAMFFDARLSKNAAAGFYVGVSHKELDVAGGMYMPGPDELAAVRAAIANKPKEIEKITSDKSLAKLAGPLRGAKLARLPKGFEEAVDPTSPAAELVRMKQWYCHVQLPAEAATRPTLVKDVVGRFKAMVPLVAYLNDVVLAARAQDEEDDGRPTRPEPMF